MAAWLRLDGLEAHAHPARLHEQHGPVESVHSAHMASWQLLGWAAGGWDQGSKFRSIFGEISVFFPFSLDTGNRNFGRFRDFSFRNLKIQKNL